MERGSQDLEILINPSRNKSILSMERGSIGDAGGREAGGLYTASNSLQRYPNPNPNPNPNPITLFLKALNLWRGIRWAN